MAKADSHCPECGVFVKPDNLPSHLRKAHGKSEEARRLERQSPRSRARGRSSAFPVWMVVVLVTVACLTAAGVYLAYRVAWAPPDEAPPVTEMCVQHTGLGLHWHAQLSISILGTPYTVPADIGIVSTTCYRPLHTHDASGTIHIELPGPRAVYLRDFFAIWGLPFSQTQIFNSFADVTHEIAMSVGGVPSGAYENLILANGQDISIVYRAL